MAGIHSLRDLNRESERQRLVNQPQPQRRNIPLLGYGFTLGTPEEARKETFGQMLKYIFCPFFEVMTFIFIITMIDIVIYFVTVFIDYDSSSFLEPRASVLDDFGAKNAEKMQEGEVWRWVTPMILHANLTHLVVRYRQYNMIMQLILGFRLEPTVGAWRTIVVYIGSGIGGILFTCLLSPAGLSVGASTAIFGITSAMLAWLSMNWSALEGDPYRLVTLIWLIMIILFNFLMGFSNTLTDNWGHFGGMITGYPIGLICFKFIDPPTSKGMWWRYGGAIFLAAYALLGFTLFYTTVST